MATLSEKWTNPLTETEHTIPAGFTRISWEDVAKGQTVYTLGRHIAGTVLAYGPHVVTMPKRHGLKNRDGLTHWEPLETLLVKEA